MISYYSLNHLIDGGQSSLAGVTTAAKILPLSYTPFLYPKKNTICSLSLAWEGRGEGKEKHYKTKNTCM